MLERFINCTMATPVCQKQTQRRVHIHEHFYKYVTRDGKGGNFTKSANDIFGQF